MVWTIEKIIFNAWKLTWKSSCKSQNTLCSLENGTTTTSFCFFLHCTMGAFLSNSWYFYEIEAKNRTETLQFHIFRLFHNTHPLIYLANIHRVSPNTEYKFGGEFQNIVRSHNSIKKHGQKRNINVIKRCKDSKIITQSVV